MARGFLASDEWNGEKILGVGSGMVRKARGMLRKRLGGPSGILRKTHGIKSGRARNNNEPHANDLQTLAFSEFHSHVHLNGFPINYPVMVI
jgi:hypothetical protein